MIYYLKNNQSSDCSRQSHSLQIRKLYVPTPIYYVLLECLKTLYVIFLIPTQIKVHTKISSYTIVFIQFNWSIELLVPERRKIATVLTICSG